VPTALPNRPSILFTVSYREAPAFRVVSTLILPWIFYPQAGFTHCWGLPSGGVVGWMKTSEKQAAYCCDIESTRWLGAGSMPQIGAALWIVWKRKFFLEFERRTESPSCQNTRPMLPPFAAGYFLGPSERILSRKSISSHQQQ
jgi:hypothetical protein